MRTTIQADRNYLYITGRGLQATTGIAPDFGTGFLTPCIVGNPGDRITLTVRPQDLSQEAVLYVGGTNFVPLDFRFIPEADYVTISFQVAARQSSAVANQEQLTPRYLDQHNFVEFVTVRNEVIGLPMVVEVSYRPNKPLELVIRETAWALENVEHELGTLDKVVDALLGMFEQVKAPTDMNHILSSAAVTVGEENRLRVLSQTEPQDALQLIRSIVVSALQHQRPLQVALADRAQANKAWYFEAVTLNETTVVEGHINQLHMNPNSTTYQGYTGLMYSAQSGNVPLTQLYLKHNDTDSTLALANGLRAEDLARGHGHEHLADMIHMHGVLRHRDPQQVSEPIPGQEAYELWLNS